MLITRKLDNLICHARPQQDFQLVASIPMVFTGREENCMYMYGICVCVYEREIQREQREREREKSGSALQSLGSLKLVETKTRTFTNIIIYHVYLYVYTRVEPNESTQNEPAVCIIIFIPTHINMLPIQLLAARRFLNHRVQVQFGHPPYSTPPHNATVDKCPTTRAVIVGLRTIL